MFVDLGENNLRSARVRIHAISRTTCAIVRIWMIAAEDFCATTRRSGGIKRYSGEPRE